MRRRDGRAAPGPGDADDHRDESGSGSGPWSGTRVPARRALSQLRRGATTELVVAWEPNDGTAQGVAREWVADVVDAVRSGAGTLLTRVDLANVALDADSRFAPLLGRALRTLRLVNCGLTDEALEAAFQPSTVALLSGLQEIVLEDNPFSDATPLARALQQRPPQSPLRVLSLSRNPNLRSGVHDALADGVLRRGLVRNCRLNHVPLASSHAAAVLSASAATGGLATLSLRDARVDDDAIRVFRDEVQRSLLGKHASIVSLDVSDNGLTNASARHLLACVRLPVPLLHVNIHANETVSMHLLGEVEGACRVKRHALSLVAFVGSARSPPTLLVKADGDTALVRRVASFLLSHWDFPF